jgi:hypothetical protein
MIQVKTTFDRFESRRDRRYPVPCLVVTIGTQSYRSINWSMGGLLLEVPQQSCWGDHVEGTLGMPGQDKAIAFQAEVVRADPEAGTLALRFAPIDAKAVDFLDRAVARRLH